MATDYSKKKNAELEELLKARSLPHTGKKAELISRLQQSDKDSASSKPPTTKEIPPEDEIDWDDDAVVPEVESSTTQKSDATIPAKAATTPAAATAIAAGGQGQTANPTAVPNQIPTDEPYKSDDLTVKPADEANTATTAPASDKKDTAEAAKPEEPAKPPTDYTAHIPPSTAEGEAERRRKRAERFGITTTTTETGTDPAQKAAAEDAIKALERAKKFGTVEGKPAVKGLDEALPERSRKRGRGGEDEVGRGGKRARGGRREGREQRNRSKSKGEGKAAGATVNGDAKAKQRADDLRKAEERKKKFGT
ncbi:MAG: hypothetical protein Q9218_005080 [Villophora microphyllina]